MSRYYVASSPLISEISTVYQRGKTQIPASIRRHLNLKDGCKIAYILENGKVYIKNLNE